MLNVVIRRDYLKLRYVFLSQDCQIATTIPSVVLSAAWILHVVIGTTEEVCSQITICGILLYRE